MVTTICYGKEDKWETREEAMKYFTECACWSEGSEKERYMNIILDLLNGETVATDGVD